MCPLMQAYKEILRYGTIERDMRYKTAWGYCRRLVVNYEEELYSIYMVNGDVLKIEVIG